MEEIDRMLVIREVQFREFERVAVRSFAERLTVYVEQVWPEECRRLGRAFTVARVQAAVKRAMGHGLTTEYDIGRFVQLVFALDDLEFYRRPWALRVLQDKSRKPGNRIDTLWANVQRQFQQRARRAAFAARMKAA